MTFTSGIGATLVTSAGKVTPNEPRREFGPETIQADVSDRCLMLRGRSASSSCGWNGTPDLTRFVRVADSTVKTPRQSVLLRRRDEPTHPAPRRPFAALARLALVVLMAILADAARNRHRRRAGDRHRRAADQVRGRQQPERRARRRPQPSDHHGRHRQGDARRHADHRRGAGHRHAGGHRLRSTRASPAMLDAGRTSREGQMVARASSWPRSIRGRSRPRSTRPRASSLQDEAALADAKLDLDRYRTLLAQDSIARQTLRRPGGAGEAGRRRGGRPTRRRSTTARLNLDLHAHPVAGRRPRRPAPDRRRQPDHRQRHDADHGRHPDRPDRRGLRRARGRRSARSCGHGDVGAGLPVTAYDRAGGTVLATGSLATLDNVDRHHHRHGEGQGALRQPRRRPVPQPVRQRDRPGRHPEEPGDRADHGRPPRPAGRLRLGAAARPDREGAAGEGRPGHRRDRLDRLGPRPSARR